MAGGFAAPRSAYDRGGGVRRLRPAMAMADQDIFDIGTPDTASLLAACRLRAAAARREVAEVAEALAANRRGPLTDRQRAQLGNMLRRLAGQIEGRLQQDLAAALEGRAELRGAGLAEFAAAPAGGAYDALLRAGPPLDHALVEAALHRMLEHGLESALRPAAADPWNHETAPGRLPAGFAADRIAAERLNLYVVERAERTDSYGEPVLRPGEIAPTVIGPLLWRIAAVLRRRAAKALRVAPEALDPDVARTAEAALAVLAQRAAAPSAAAQVVAAMAEAGAPDGGLAIEALRQAELPLSVALVARLAGLRPALVRRLIFEPDGLGLAILARAAGLGAEQLEAAFSLTRHARAPARAADGRRLLALFGRIAAEDAQRVCAHWRLPPPYLEAAWRLDAAEGGGADRS